MAGPMSPGWNRTIRDLRRSAPEPVFTNYHLSVKTAYFNQHFRRVRDTAGG